MEADGLYYYEIVIEKTDMSSLPAAEVVKNWTEFGPKAELTDGYGKFPDFGNWYMSAAIGNNANFTATNFTASGMITLSAGQYLPQ